MLSDAATINRDERTPVGVFRLISLALAFIYAAFFVLLSDANLKDRENYLAYATNAAEIFAANISVSPMVALFNEPIWLGLNALGRYFFEPDVVLALIIFLPAFVISFLVLSQGPRDLLWLLAFLLIAQVLKNNIIHLRQGLAISVFLLGWFSSDVFLRRLLIISAGFIHSSFIIVIILLLLSRLFLRWRLALDFRLVIVLSLGLLIGFGLKALAETLGARQGADLDFAASNISGLGFVFWAAVLLVILCEGRDYLRHHAFQVSLIVFYLSTYFLLGLTARIFESGLILVLLSGLKLTSWRRHFFLVGTLFWASAQWFVQAQSPCFGFCVV